MSKQEPPEEIISGPTPADVPVETLPVVELTEQQYQRAQNIAHHRNHSYQSIDGGRICGEQTSEDAHLTGAIGELAFASERDVSIDESIYQFGDAGYDFRESTITIDIKTTATNMQNPALLVPVDPKPRADLFFLLHRVGERRVRIIGFATLATVTDREAIPKPGSDLNYVVPQDELWLPPTLDERDDENPNHAQQNL